MNNSVTSSPAPDADGESRRRSGRVVRAPEKFSPEPQSRSVAPVKRKRGMDQDDDEAENDAPDSDADPSDDEDDDDGGDDVPSTDEEVRASRASRRKKSSQPSRARKPALKKPKTNGAHASTNLPRRPKTVRIAHGVEDVNGLFGMHGIPAYPQGAF